MGELKQFYPLSISDIRPETEQAVCITFAIPKKLEKTFQFLPGQFLTLRSTVDNEKVVRSYSICSSPSDGCMSIGIKRVNHGQFSNHANDHFKVGDSVDVMPPQGNFYVEIDPKNEKNYMFIAAGSGITPIISNIKAVLHGEPKSQVTLLYGNSHTNSVMFLETLAFIKNQFMQCFQWINIMNQEDQGSDFLKGIIDNQKGAALHKHRLIDIKNTDEVFICGPQAMMSEVSRGFRMMGFDDSRIRYELFTSSFEDSRLALDKYNQRIEKYGEEKLSNVTIIVDDRSINFDLAMVGESILDAGLRHGFKLPFSCKAGVCSTCIAKLMEGDVEMDINHALDEQQIKDRYILTCQAHPLSDKITISFDQ